MFSSDNHHHNHGDDHHHEHDHHGHHHSITKNIGAALLLNASFTLIEMVGAALTGSVAIFSDAIHDLGDTVILSFSYFSEKYAVKKPEDKSFTYGFSRLPLLSAFLSALVLLVGSAFVMIEAIPRLWEPQEPDGIGMMVLAVPGILINAAAIFKLKGSEGINTRVLSLHLLEDVLGWVAVLIGGGIIHFFHLPIVDPILSILITLYILTHVAGSLKNSIQLFIQKAPENIKVEDIKKEIRSIQGISEICDLHLWTLDSIQHIFTIHVRIANMKDEKKISAIKDQIRTVLNRHGQFHSTIEIEYGHEKCHDRC